MYESLAVTEQAGMPTYQPSSAGWQKGTLELRAAACAASFALAAHVAARHRRSAAPHPQSLAGRCNALL